jgi:hypothetical protein
VFDESEDGLQGDSDDYIRYGTGCREGPCKNIKHKIPTRMHIFALSCKLLERMGGREGLTSQIPFHADFNELLFVSIALTLMEISVDCDRC